MTCEAYWLQKAVDGTGSGSCSMAGFGISGVGPSGSATGKWARVEIVWEAGERGGRWNSPRRWNFQF
jgi:hypothetical protein